MILSPRLVRGYQNDDRLRHSFNRLTRHVFDFELEAWYQRGLWDSRYVPVSFIQDNEIIANVSCNRMKLLIDDVSHSAIQIGTVMTHPKWRGQGLASRLMELVLNQYADECDFFFLFANDSTFDWYPQFGFERREESWFVSQNPVSDETSVNLIQLDLNNEKDYEWMLQLAERRIPLSKRFGVIGGENLFMYHALYLHPEHIYRITGEDVAVIAWVQGSTLHLVDIISEKPVEYDLIIAALHGLGSISKVAFHFTPDLLDLNAVALPAQSKDALFVYPGSTQLPAQFYRQETGVA